MSTYIDTKNLSPQSQQIYRLLLTQPAMTAREIGEKIGILPNAAYRSMRLLIDLGFAQKIGRYPARFEAHPLPNAVDEYLLDTKMALLKAFTQKSVYVNKQQRLLRMSSIKDRNDFIEQTNKDLSQARGEVNLIVSGLEVPAETILQYKRAVDRGVKMRVIVQRLDEVSKEMFFNWTKMGIEVRYLPTIEARVCIIDNRIVFFTSYNPQVKDEGLGVRFEYPPVAKIMNELFESSWKKAKTLFKSA